LLYISGWLPLMGTLGRTGNAVSASSSPGWHRGRIDYREHHTEGIMLYHNAIGAAALAATLSLTMAGARAADAAKFPDWSGQWIRIGGVQWDPSKPRSRGQQAPLTAEYQAIFDQSLADQDAGGQGNNSRFTCRSSGMPRIMTAVYPLEIVIEPKITYVLSEYVMPRRIYTDGRAWPKEAEPSFAGYSIGKWTEDDGEGRYNVIEIETRSLKGPRDFDGDGLPLHKDNQTVIKERIYLDKANPDLLHDEITTIDHALTRPWTVTKNFRRERNPIWTEYDCNENNNHVVIGKESYFLSADGYLMPAKKGQQPPDARYFK
jgi:hypothetical protein